jgi:CDP-glycerol glycerophosphotransferase
LRFSAIVVFYNQRDFVRTAMDSVLSQATDGLEVIAVDDGSTDGTSEVLSEYRDRARLVFLEQNRGTCAARNAGTEVATGEYLAYLDGDDAFLPWAIDTYAKLPRPTRPY